MPSGFPAHHLLVMETVQGLSVAGSIAVHEAEWCVQFRPWDLFHRFRRKPFLRLEWDQGDTDAKV
jgi:hypothetical protein